MTETPPSSPPLKRPPTPLAMALAVAMARDGWNITELANGTGVSRSALDRVIKGAAPSAKHRDALTAYLERRGWALLMVTEPLERAHRSITGGGRKAGDLEAQLLDEMTRARTQAQIFREPLPDHTAEIKRFFDLARRSAGDSQKHRLFRMKLAAGDYEAITFTHEALTKLAKQRRAELSAAAEADTPEP